MDNNMVASSLSLLFPPFRLPNGVMLLFPSLIGDSLFPFWFPPFTDKPLFTTLPFVYITSGKLGGLRLAMIIAGSAPVSLLSSQMFKNVFSSAESPTNPSSPGSCEIETQLDWSLVQFGNSGGLADEVTFLARSPPSWYLLVLVLTNFYPYKWLQHGSEIDGIV